MAVIIVKPLDDTDPNYDEDLNRYNTQIEGVRRKASPDISVKLTEEQLPESDIGSDEYLAACERLVLSATGTSESEVTSLSRNSSQYKSLVYLLQVQIAIKFIPQLPQIVREGDLQDVSQYQSIDWQKKLMELKAEYNEQLTLVSPEAETGSLNPRVRITRSRKSGIYG